MLCNNFNSKGMSSWKFWHTRRLHGLWKYLVMTIVVPKLDTFIWWLETDSQAATWMQIGEYVETVGSVLVYSERGMSKDSIMVLLHWIHIPCLLWEISELNSVSVHKAVHIQDIFFWETCIMYSSSVALVAEEANNVYDMFFRFLQIVHGVINFWSNCRGK